MVHIDHIGAIFNHARAHVLMRGGTPATYYVPSALIPTLENARKAISNLDGLFFVSEEEKSTTEGGKRELIKMNIVGVEDGTEIELKQKKRINGIQYVMRCTALSGGVYEPWHILYRTSGFVCSIVGYLDGSRCLR